MESVATINQRLIDHYGTDSDTNQPMFRIVWANDQTEKRLIDYSDAGVYWLHPEVREVKKYPYLKDLFVLERLVVVPEVNAEELPTMKLSYEPVWAFRDENNTFITPLWTATKFIVDTIYAVLGKKSLAVYVDSEKNTTPEGREQRISELKQELFGNETDEMDAVRYREGLTVPSNYKKDE